MARQARREKTAMMAAMALMVWPLSVLLALRVLRASLDPQAPKRETKGREVRPVHLETTSPVPQGQMARPARMERRKGNLGLKVHRGKMDSMPTAHPAPKVPPALTAFTFLEIQAAAVLPVQMAPPVRLVSQETNLPSWNPAAVLSAFQRWRPDGLGFWMRWPFAFTGLIRK